MKTNISNWKQIFCLTQILMLCAATEIHAQSRGGFGGFRSFGGGFNNPSTASSSSTYNNNGTVGNAVISVDPETHNIVVIADAETSQQISNVIANLDEPKPQVLIKVVFMEVQRNNSSAIGVQGDYTGLSKNFSQLVGYTTNYGIFTGGGSNAIPTIAPSSITPIKQSVNAGNNFGLPQTLAGATGNGGLYQFLGNDFTATLQAIAAAGNAQVLSRPSILARDGQLAKIVVGQEVYLPSGVSYTTAGNNTTIPVINGTYTDVGIILDVTPYIGANRLVQMIIQPQISSVDTSSPGQLIAAGSSLLGASSTPVYAPNINVRSADTVVVTPDAQTVVIGGLIANNKATAESKVPILGDIPLLGNLFKFKSKSDDRTELLMFLTPHIVEAPNQLAAMANGEMSQTPIITNSVSEQELDQFLERLPAKKTK